MKSDHGNGSNAYVINISESGGLGYGSTDGENTPSSQIAKTGDCGARHTQRKNKQVFQRINRKLVQVFNDVAEEHPSCVVHFDSSYHVVDPTTRWRCQYCSDY